MRTIQQYLRAGLIDEMHLAIVPVLLGSGERLFEGLAEATADYEVVELASSPAVAHVRLARRPPGRGGVGRPWAELGIRRPW